MKDQISKSLFVLLGVFLLILGLFGAGFGGWRLATLDPGVDETVLRARLTQQCKTISGKQGYEIEHLGSRLILRQAGLDDYKAKLYRASWAVQACEGFVMTRFCMGACEMAPGGLVIALTYSDSERRQPLGEEEKNAK